MQHLLKNTVVCASLVAIGAFATWIVLRPRLPRGDGFTDGELTPIEPGSRNLSVTLGPAR